MKYIIMIALLLLTSCYQLFKIDKEYIKEIRTANIYIEWFHNSGIGTIVPDFIITKNLKTNTSDTICVAYNIKDLYLKDDTIVILFNGSPNLHPSLHPILNKIPEKIYTYPIFVDSLQYIFSPHIKPTYSDGIYQDE